MEEKIAVLWNKVLKLNDCVEKVDAMNELSWLLRYERTGEGLDLALTAQKTAIELKYDRGETYAKLYQSVNRYLTELDEEVIRLLLEVLDIFDENEEGYSKAHNFLAMVHESYGDYETALDHAHLAVESAEKMQYKEGEGDGLSTLALIYNRLCDFPQALKVFKKSLEIRQQLGNDKAVASSLNLLARTYSLSGEYDLALEHYRISMELRQRINDKSGLPWTFLGIASVMENQKQFEGALNYYNKSLELNKHLNEKRLELLCKIGIGKAYLNLKNYQNAGAHLDMAMEIALALNAKPLLANVHQALAVFYEKTGKLHKALDHLKKFQMIEKEINSLESHNRLKNQQIVFATEQSRKEAEIFQLRNVELKAAYDEIEAKNHEITESIKYAERIQRAVLPPDDYLKEILPEHFILFLPRDVVSGDYYWATKKEDKIVFTAADCTGHGIPGAFMSMLGVSYLNEIVNRMNELKANEILNELRLHIMHSLHQKGAEGEQKDGMDMGLCVYDKSTGRLQFSGAYNSMYLVRNKELEELKADRMPISIHDHGKKPFTNHELQLQKNDVVYLFSDGYPDQFGGPKGKKFKYKALKELILSISGEPMSRQRKKLIRVLKDWKGDLDQVDDIIIFGLRF
jgi:serine phosphatase RsbU (regulator of sigma subunit)